MKYFSGLWSIFVKLETPFENRFISLYGRLNEDPSNLFHVEYDAQKDKITFSGDWNKIKGWDGAEHDFIHAGRMAAKIIIGAKDHEKI